MPILDARAGDEDRRVRLRRMVHLALGVMAPGPLAAAAHAAPAPDVGWAAYGNDAGGSHHSPLADIDRANVRQLLVAWTFHTGAFATKSPLDGKAAFEATPIVAGGLLVFTTPFSEVIALDPGTGTARWRFDPK